MHVLHECEEPKLWIASGLLQAFEGGCASFAADRVALDTIVGELPFRWCKPLCG
jgi:hypothetical protein